MRKLTQEEIIRKFIEKHGNEYSYHKFVYTNSKEKGIITCRKHGDFLQPAEGHLRGRKCPECAKLNRANAHKVSLTDLLTSFCKVHGYKYDYSNVNYVNNETKIEIICRYHGKFKQTPHNHKSGQGCPECGKEATRNKQKHSFLKVIDICNEVHGYKYIYNDVEYVNEKSMLSIVCPTHGLFFQSVNSHKRGKGCPNCSESKGEREIRKFLTENDINYK